MSDESQVASEEWVARMEKQIKEHGIAPKLDVPKVESGTGAKRSDASGKGRPSLIPPWALERLAQHFEQCSVGPHGYPERNWEKGIKISRFVDSTSRHLWGVLSGDTSEPHAVSLLWNTICMLETLHRIETGELPAELNDLPWASEGKEGTSDDSVR
jgi:hypothetical protein